MEAVAERGELLRVLGTAFGVAVAVGGIIGAGILRAPATIAAIVPNGWIMLALWVGAALAAALYANVLSELATAMPRSGGFVVYVREALGDVWGLAVGWTDWMAGVCAIAALTVAFAEFLGLIWPFAAAHVGPVAAVMQIALFGLNAIGVREGSALQHLASAVKVALLSGFVVAAVAVAGHVTSVPLPGQTVAGHVAAAQPLGWAALIGAYQMIDGAYAGWYNPIYFAGENTDPARALPRAMGLAIFLSASLYVAINAALLAALGPAAMAHTALPFMPVLQAAGGAAAGLLFALCAMLIVLSCANSGVMGVPRILYALGKDGLLPAMFTNVNRGGTPHVALGLTAAASVALALSGSFTLVFGLIATLGASAIMLTVVSYFVLRRRRPEMARPYRAALHPWLPGLALLLSGALFVLYLTSNWQGAAYAAVLWLLCIPFAMLARRARAAAPA